MDDTCKWDISSKYLGALFTACCFDIAVQDNTTQFCSLFDEDDILAYEYAKDLEKYYRSGYGIPLSYQISCPLMQSFFDGIQSVIDGTSPSTATLLFAHAETVLPFVSNLVFFSFL